MDRDWKNYRIEDIAETVAMGPFGSNIPVSCFVGQGIPVISGQHLNNTFLTESDFNYVTEEKADSLANSNAYRGDIIFTHSGNIGQVSVIPENSRYQRYVLSQRQFKLTLNTDLAEPYFIVYFFQSPYGRYLLLANSNPTGVPSISRPVTYLKSVEIPIPPLWEQQAIVRILKSMDDKIELLRRQNETLESVAQTLFKHWFIYFEFQDEKGQPYRSSGGNMVPTEEFGEIPEGWRVLQLGDICSTIYRYPQFYGMEKFEHGIPVIRGEHLLSDGKIDHNWNNYWFVDQSYSEQFPRTILKEFDVVLSVRGTVGNFAIVGEKHVGAQISPNTIRLSSNAKILLNFLLYPLLKSNRFSERLLNTISSSAVPALNASEYRDLEFVVPPMDLQRRICDIFKSIYKKIDINTIMTQSLTRTRDLILPKLMSGQIRVNM